MTTATIQAPAKNDRSWEKVVLKYARPELRKSLWQIANSVIPYVLSWYAMYWSLQYSYWITLLISLLATGFLVRIFIIFHDCGHNSFFKSPDANKYVGMILGILAFTPYHKWHGQHKIHHATSANLDKRGIGDIWTMTVDEYINASKRTRFFYRICRNPFLLFVFGPIYVVMVQNRITTKEMTLPEKRNVYFTNFALLGIAATISMFIGWEAYLLIQMPIILIAHCIGLWLFFIQHQFEDVEWERTENWEYKTAAIYGSSFLKLPTILQWFTGNIGFHHVHHLSSRIPNYNLAECHYKNELFKNVKPITLKMTTKALNLHLWDEAAHEMISFKKLRRR